MVASTVETKKHLRFRKSLSIVVKGKHNEAAWNEVAEMKSFSRTGAGFTLENECQVGQLLSLMIPLPKNLRCYDEEKELYRVWGLIQHCSPYSDENGSGFHVGVAFIGKNAPQSYRADSQQSYKISGMSEEGLWQITETNRPFIHRKNPRFWSSIRISLEIYETEAGEVVEEACGEEITATENISVSGALVYSNLAADIGDCLKFSSAEYEFSTLAIVRNRNAEAKPMPKLHLEFVGNQFPVQKIKTQIEEAEKN